MKRYLLILVIVLLGGIGITAVSWPAAAEETEPTSSPIYAMDIFPGLTFDQPTAIVNAGDARLFVLEQPGRIWIVKGEGADASRTLFLDISDRVTAGGEQGLLGLVFHPQYAQNGYFYVNYTTDIGEPRSTHISRFQVTADPDVADPQSELLLLDVEQPYANHNGGDLYFDPGGMLIIGLGDGGSGGDPQQRAQNGQLYLGKLLRIDVDSQEGDLNYAIPEDNPFLDQENVLDEIWTLGLRNPWRFSFDSQNGDLYIGDVGQNAWEEVDYVPAAAAGGQNFEWSIKEGFSDYNPNQDAGPGVMTEPVQVYPHEDDGFCDSITGGYVYRGGQMSDFYGTYFYADYCDGRIWGLKRDQGGNWINELLIDSSATITTFGVDQQNELYFADRNTGHIYRFVGSLDQELYLPLILQ
jgi:glucose/arabinose dehydrogenase